MTQPNWTLVVGTCLAVLHVASVGTTFAQQPADAARLPDQVSASLDRLFEEIDEKSLNEAPKRDYKVEKGQEKEIKLFKTDPKLLENKFVASARLVAMRHVPRDPRPDRSIAQMEGQMMAELMQPELTGGIPIHWDPAGRSLYTGRPSRAIIGSINTPIREYFSSVIPLCPKAELPSKDIVDFLTSAESDRDISWTIEYTQGDVDWLIEAYAPTQLAAEQRVAAIIRVLDCALCRPLQRTCLSEGRKSLQAARKGYEDVAKQSEGLQVEEGKSVTSSELTQDILLQLKSQKVSVSIELATLNARVKKCDEKLKELENKPQGALLETVNDLKVKAEIDLAAVKEKLAQIDAFIAEANNATAHRAKILQMQSSLGQLREGIRRHERRAETLGRAVLLCEPLPLKVNQMTISPVKWTN